MFTKSSWVHLRIPFSFFLLPVFAFALSSINEVNVFYGLIVFFALHLFLYPASNGYNSYFDKDEGSIGGIKAPPKVNNDLYYLALLFDAIALILASYNFIFFLMLLTYGLVSKAYSHPSIRIKKYPFASWFIAGFFQGFFTFLMANIGLIDGSFSDIIEPKILYAGCLTSIMLWGSYPMTQIYQHEEDTKRGDVTLSVKLGVLGTFHFVAIFFFFSSLLFFWFFLHHYSIDVSLIYLGAMGPVVSFFAYWYIQVRKDKKLANFDNTMKLNFLSSLCLNAFFIWLWIMR